MSNRKDPSFSIYEFKYWLEKQPKSELKFPSIAKSDIKHDSIAMGEKVESRLGICRLEVELLKYNETLENSIETAKYFKENGGKIIEQRSDLTVFVETDVGSFVIPRMYTKPASS